MKRFVLFTALIALCSFSSSAQLGIYGKLDLDHHTDSNSNSTYMLYGGGVGLYYNFVHAGPMTVGGDARGDFSSGNNYSYRSFLLGLPVGVRLPVIHIRPYVEPLLGVGGSKYTGPVAAGITGVSYHSKLTYGFVGGIDWTVLPHVDWRMIEAGFNREKNGTLPDPNILISTGVVARF